MARPILGPISCGAMLAIFGGVVGGSALAQGAERAASAVTAAGEPFLADLVQLTFPDRFSRAGEAYFSPDGRWIIFQAVPVGATSTGYAMYVGRLARDERTGLVTGLEDIVEVSPPESVNTCGWFHPTLAGVVLFGCAQGPLSDDQPAGYSRDRSRYTWAFPREMEVVTRTVRQIVEREVRDEGLRARLLARPDVDAPQALWTGDGYDAEASWTADGRAVLHTWMDPRTQDADISVRVLETGERRPLVVAPGYDGGPFFSPDGKWICYRSDRRGDNMLQLFVAELTFDGAGLPSGIAREVQLTDNQSVNWAPFWHPDGTFLVYASSQVGHDNYEVFAIPFDAKDPRASDPVRVTFAEGFDGLPVFNARGSLMMWTAQRGADSTASGRPSSQLWVARTTGRAPAGLGSAPVTTQAPAAGAGPSMGAIRVRFGIMPGNYDDSQPGIEVADVTAGASAASAGIRAGDRLMTWNGTAVRDVVQWMGLLGEHEPGDVVTVGVRRDGRMIEIAVTLQGR